MKGGNGRGIIMRFESLGMLKVRCDAASLVERCLGFLRKYPV